MVDRLRGGAINPQPHETPPDLLAGDEGETVFVRRDLATTVTAARAYALSQGYNLAAMEPDAVEMLPVPEWFINVDAEWWTVKPGTLGSIHYWRFRA